MFVSFYCSPAGDEVLIVAELVASPAVLGSLEVSGGAFCKQGHFLPYSCAMID